MLDSRSLEDGLDRLGMYRILVGATLGPTPCSDGISLSLCLSDCGKLYGALASAINASERLAHAVAISLTEFHSSVDTGSG